MLRASLTSLLLLAGCVAVEPPPPLPPPEGPPQPALALAPLGVAYQPTPPRPDPPEAADATAGDDAEEDLGFAPPYQPVIDAEQVRTRASEWLAERGHFARVLALPPPPAGRDPTEALRQAARAAGCEFLLEWRLDAADTRLAGRTWLHGVKIGVLVVSSILIFPAVDPFNWFLPGEEYAIELRGRWTLRKTLTGESLARGRFITEHRDAFAPLGLGIWPSRGWFIVGFLRVDECLEQEHWEDIAAHLGEGAHEALARELVRVAEASPPKPRE